MKKLAVLIFALMLCSGITAQTKATKKIGGGPMVAHSVSVKESFKGNDGITSQQSEAVPYQLSEPKGYTNGQLIGQSYWPSQSNTASWHNRLVAHANGTMSCAWPTSGPGTGADRGTGYNFFDGTQWTGNPTSTARIETTRAGWGCIAALGNGGEIVVSHNGSTGLLINKRAVAGQGSWEESVLLGPAITRASTQETSTALLWPVLATVGDTVHIFAITESDTGYYYQGMNQCLVYYRSVDNGATWDIEADLVAGITAADIDGFGADHYEITAREGCIALIYGERFNDVFILKSIDGGANWTKQVVFDHPLKNLDWDTEYFDTTWIPAPNFGIAIDENKNVHVAFGFIRAMRNEENEPQYFTIWTGAYLTVMTYWNETMPAMGGSVVDVNNAVKNETFPLFVIPDIMGEGEIAWLLSDASLSNSEYTTSAAHILQPKMIIEGNTVYMFYVSAIPYPFRDMITTSYWHGIFATKSIDGGTTWDSTDISWLSYSGNLFQVNWDFYRAKITAGEEAGYAMDESMFIYSENAFPSVCALGDEFHLTWFTDDLSGVESTFPLNTPYSLYSMKVKKDEIGVFNKITEIFSGQWNDMGIHNNTLSASQIYPNPVSDKLNMVIASTQADKAMVTMTNMLGQTVYSRAENLTAGANYLDINVADYNAGIYIVNVKTATGIISHKVIVK
jgi:hypothetical protein